MPVISSSYIFLGVSALLDPLLSSFLSRTLWNILLLLVILTFWFGGSVATHDMGERIGWLVRTSGVGGARTNRMLYHIIMLRYARGIGSHKKEKPIPSGRCENYRMGLWGKEMSKIRDDWKCENKEGMDGTKTSGRTRRKTEAERR